METTVKLQLPKELEQATLELIEASLNSVVAEIKASDQFPEYMNQKQASKYLGISPVTFIKWEKNYSDFPNVIIEGVKRYKKSALNDFMEKHNRQ